MRVTNSLSSLAAAGALTIFCAGCASISPTDLGMGDIDFALSEIDLGLSDASAPSTPVTVSDGAREDRASQSFDRRQEAAFTIALANFVIKNCDGVTRDEAAYDAARQQLTLQSVRTSALGGQTNYSEADFNQRMATYLREQGFKGSGVPQITAFLCDVADREVDRSTPLGRLIKRGG